MSAPQLLVLAGLAFWACAGRSDGMAESVAASLEVEPTSSVVRLTLTVSNPDQAPAAFTFPSSQRFDFVVLDAAGEEVWRWSDGLAFTQALVRDTLPAGGTWRLEGEWHPGGAGGRFTAIGRLTVMEPVEARASFELP